MIPHLLISSCLFASKAGKLLIMQPPSGASLMLNVACQPSDLLDTVPEEALAARFTARRYEAGQRLWRVLTESPQPAQAMADEVGMPYSLARQALERLVKAGAAFRIDRVQYMRRVPDLPAQVTPTPGPEVGRIILGCLSEPRRARDIALRIGKSGSCTTGHLRHLLRRGLVVRVAWGVYGLASRCGPVDSMEPVRRHWRRRQVILTLLADPHTVDELCGLVRDERRFVRATVTGLRRAGAIVSVGDGRYVVAGPPASAGGRRAVRSAAAGALAGGAP